MGFLSDSARKAYRKGSRRAHVPEWFEPAAYAFGVIVGVVLLLGMVFADDPEPVGTETTAPGPLVIVADGAEVDGLPDTGTAGSTTVAPADGATDDTVNDPGAAAATDEPVTLLDGTAGTAPAGAWKAAQDVTFALLTGNFDKVAIYPGKTAPIMLTTWPEPVILGIVDVEDFPDGTVEFVVRVDPDGSGVETARDVPLTLARDRAAWAYLPG